AIAQRRTSTRRLARRCQRFRSGSFGKLRTARVGSVGGQRLGLPLTLVRAAEDDPSPAAHVRALVRAAAAVLQESEVLVVDGEFGVRLLQEGHVATFVARAAKNVTARRASLA